MSNPERIRAPWWMKPANRFYNVLLRRGVHIGREHSVVLTVTGRKSGQPRSTPVTPLHVGGHRFVVATFPGADWVTNVRATPTATITDGARTEDVRMVELDEAQAAPVLRHFGEQVPAGVGFLKRSGLVAEGTAEEVEALAGRLPVFRIDPVT